MALLILFVLCGLVFCLLLNMLAVPKTARPGTRALLFAVSFLAAEILFAAFSLTFRLKPAAEFAAARTAEQLALVTEEYFPGAFNTPADAEEIIRVLSLADTDALLEELTAGMGTLERFAAQKAVRVFFPASAGIASASGALRALVESNADSSGQISAAMVLSNLQEKISDWADTAVFILRIILASLLVIFSLVFFAVARAYRREGGTGKGIVFGEGAEDVSGAGNRDSGK